jgi:succinate-semialdehyde dehydrogenase/glutarate-semialdehyde dehydrogenase
LQEFQPHSDEEVERRLTRASEAFQEFRGSTFEQRASAMERVAEILEAERNDLAITMTREMGKPIRAAVQEVEKCALVCRYYAANAARFLADEEVPGQEVRSFVRFQPLGAVLAIMPWNFPFWQVFRFAAPALMAGNVGLLKHASNVPQCALAIEEVFRRADFPEGAFQTLLVPPEQVNHLIADARISAVTLTGSLGAGRRVASTAGKHIKKTVLELGGSDPFIVMPSADLAEAVATAVQARTVNSGQSCIAAKRFILHERIAAEFEKGFVARMASLRVGDPMDKTTDLGPLATAGVLENLETQVNETKRMGARVLLGGKRLQGPGYFFQPTVLADIPNDSPAHKEELFGPVASLWRVADMEEAIGLANETSFGLGACAWTKDQCESKLFIEEIQAGLAFVNQMVASSPSLPFGGVKQSGYGRELGIYGIREFVNVKTVSIHA